MSSDCDFDLIHSWVTTCNNHHNHCKKKCQTPQSWYPSRLLDIGLCDDEVKLILTKERHLDGPYMTLSHRWGSHDYQRLETKSEIVFQSHIDVTNHPRVFREAVHIARRLEIRYMWIDALCIKQDDLDDWKAESVVMDLVYSNSYLNISATLSEDGTESLFQQSGWDTLLPTFIELDFDDTTEHFYVFDDDIWNDEIEAAPLNTRGWVFQERFLSRRILHFGSQQLAWECQELCSLEMFKSEPPSLAPISGMKASDKRGKKISEHNFREFWHGLVQKYSETNLTKKSDKLIALKGVVNSIQTPVHGMYLAGVWESTLLYDLAWSRNYQVPTQTPLENTSSCAPSWSWVSVDEEVSFPVFTPQTTVIQLAAVETMHGDNFYEGGTLKSSGTVGVRGFCLPIRLHWSDDQTLVGFSIYRAKFLLVANLSEHFLAFDLPSGEVYELGKRGRLLVVPLFQGNASVYGIIIAKTRGVSAYHRVGALEINYSTDYDPLKDPGISRAIASDLIGPEGEILDERVLSLNEIPFDEELASNLLIWLFYQKPPSSRSLKLV